MTAAPDFEDYFHARVRWLRRVAYGLVGDWQSAEDLAQATLLQLFRHWNRVRDTNIDAYARRTLVNQFLDSRKFRAEVPRAQVPDRSADEPDVDAAVDLAAALERLPRQMRAVLVLRFLDDQSVRDVAQLLGIAEGTVKAHTNHALTSMRHLLVAPGSAPSHGGPS